MISKSSAPALESHKSAAAWLQSKTEFYKDLCKWLFLITAKTKGGWFNYLICNLRGRITLLASKPTRRGLGQTTRSLRSNPTISSRVMKAFCWRLQWFIFFTFDPQKNACNQNQIRSDQIHHRARDSKMVNLISKSNNKKKKTRVYFIRSEKFSQGKRRKLTDLNSELFSLIYDFALEEGKKNRSFKVSERSAKRIFEKKQKPISDEKPTMMFDRIGQVETQIRENSKFIRDFLKKLEQHKEVLTRI